MTIKQHKISFEQADLSESEFNYYVEVLDNIVCLKEEIDSEFKNDKHPWHFVASDDLSLPQQNELKELIREWKDGLEKIQLNLESFNKEFNLFVDNTTQAVEIFCNYLNNLVDYNTSTLNEAFIANLGSKEKADAFVLFIEQIHKYRLRLEKIQYIQNASTIVNNTQEIERDILAAKENEVDNMITLDMQKHVNDLEGGLKLWDNNLKSLLDIGEWFGLLKNEGMDKILHRGYG
ncbi:hypothetical protein CAXC1_110007 [Candidatus Xenohaliotis californiensis]|uniref:Uncharacterized protein n=1 Tax=Candidatus Xenohaliotis californiensis TaxID=84677 RepID=A0ABM9N6W9_9RICK|nr:hypothetical protein CAXC1_110007 [Candidatus Xenohaliotis californiensis]